MAIEDFIQVPTVPGLAEDNIDMLVGAEVVLLLEANPNRKSALIMNVGEASMRVTTDGSDPSPTKGKRVGAGENLSLTSPYCPILEVKAIREGDQNTTVNASEVN